MDSMNEPPALRWYLSEDWLSVWIGGLILAICLIASRPYANAISDPTLTSGVQTPEHPLASILAKPQKWTNDISQSLIGGRGFHGGRAYASVAAIACLLFGIGIWLRGERFWRFTLGFVPIFLLATLSLTLAAQKDIKAWNLEYALWALGLGLIISNTVGTAKFIRPALRTEFYIKTGLVLLGAKILFSKLMYLGPRGLAVAWIVTPVVLITTYWFGQRVLRIPSRSLNMVISADMSVCGVSAAIATSAACKAKKEELSLAIGISLTFTVIMMVVMPMVITTTGMNERVGGAWLGGTIDSTGAVAAAGSMIGPEAEDAAVTIKMIQNILIGVTAFGVALYWVRYVENDNENATNHRRTRPDVSEIWHRFPKFVIGFLLASIVFSLLHRLLDNGPAVVDATLKGGSEILRTWFFAFAFVSIGLETNFRELKRYLKGGKPLLLYACGQSLNLLLTLLAASWMFGE